MNSVCSDGTCVRDYLHVLDLASGHLLALNALGPDSSIFEKSADSVYFKAYNLGKGKGMSVLDILQAMRKATGFDFKYTIIGRRYDERFDVMTLMLITGNFNLGKVTYHTSSPIRRLRSKSSVSRRQQTSRRCAVTCGIGRRKTQRATPAPFLANNPAP